LMQVHKLDATKSARGGKERQLRSRMGVQSRSGPSRIREKWTNRGNSRSPKGANCEDTATSFGERIANCFVP